MSKYYYYYSDTYDAVLEVRNCIYLKFKSLMKDKFLSFEKYLTQCCQI